MAYFILRNDESSVYGQNLTTVGNEDGDDFMKNASKGRRATDVPFLIFHAICVGFLSILIIYCIATGDIDRIIKGYDTCGNICGKKNDFDIMGTSNCLPRDMSDKPHLSLLDDNGYNQCTNNCTDGVLFLNRCIGNGKSHRHIDDSWFYNILVDLNLCVWEISAVSFLTVVFAFITLLMLRYYTAVFVLCSIVGAILLLAAITGFSWYVAVYEDASIIPLAIPMSIVTLSIIILVIFLRNRIELVIVLFKESAKSLISMPLLLIEPLMTFVVLAITFIAWMYFSLWIESAATPVGFPEKVEFAPSNSFIKFIHFYNLFVMLWQVLFVYGCQNMLIAGAVARWYFIRDKAMLVNPILNSRVTMLKYHLGTISIGSLIMAVISIIRMLWAAIRSRIRRLSYLCCLCLCFGALDEVIRTMGSMMNYFNLNIYVVSAIHGSTFYTSGKKAFNLLMNNIKNVVAVNSIGDFVILLTKVLIVGISVAIGYLMIKDKGCINIAVPLVFITVIAIVVAQCFVVVLEMTITTIFICFCEDCKINDGLSRPYYMSQNLMEFVEKSKAVLKVKDIVDLNKNI